jgi:hypothetical protein
LGDRFQGGIRKEEWQRTTGNILSGKHRDDARYAATGVGVDIDNPGMCVRRTHEGQMNHSRLLDISDIFPLASQNPLISLTSNALPHVLH